MHELIWLPTASSFNEWTVPVCPWGAVTRNIHPGWHKECKYARKDGIGYLTVLSYSNHNVLYMCFVSTLGLICVQLCILLHCVWSLNFQFRHYTSYHKLILCFQSTHILITLFLPCMYKWWDTLLLILWPSYMCTCMNIKWLPLMIWIMILIFVCCAFCSWIDSKSHQLLALCVICCGLTRWRTLVKRNRLRKLSVITQSEDAPTISGNYASLTLYM